MLLQSLELQGFKTFPDKTTLTFHNGITAVVGPNGSGKSNISDAVRWVLGEQSAHALRCTRMEDVIFSGTPSRKALGFAEVTLNIDNAARELPYDADSVSVTRRYYRSGESEYLINGTAVRLKDVNELFMDTGLGRDGYSMIGQGRIDSIVAAKSEDRREIFEEAAGISRFRYRKEESEHRLAQAEENLLRLRDIVSELETRLGPLKEQAEKAKKYLAWSGEKRKLEIGLWLGTLDRSGQTLREHEDKIAVARNQYDAAGRAVDELESKIEQTFNESNRCAAQADEVRKRGAELEENAAKKDGEVSVLQNDIRHNGEAVARIENEIEQNRLSGGGMDREIAEKKERIAERREYIKTQDARYAESSAERERLRRGMDESAAKIDGLQRSIAELTSRATGAKMEEMTAASSSAEIELRLSAVRDSEGLKKEQAAGLEQQAGGLAEKLKEADARIESLGNAARGCELRLDARRRRAEAAKQESDRLALDAEEHSRRARLLEDLERNLEGFSQSVKAVMKESARGSITGIHGPVSRLMRVPGRYAVAIETALGGAMQNIVVGDEQDAKRAIALLKERGAGRATFLPLSTIRGRVLQENGLAECAGFVGIASELCTCKETYREILNSLLGRIAVAEDLDSAVEIARKYGYRFRIVTLDGQVVNAGGSLTGGSLARNSGLLSRASEIEKIRAQAAELKTRADAAAEALKLALSESSAAEAALTAARAELATAREERVHLDAEHRRALADLQSAKNDLDALEKERGAASERLEEQKKTREDAHARADGFEEQARGLKQELEKVSGGSTELNRRCEVLDETLRQIDLDRLAAKKDAESLAASVAEIEKRKLEHAGRAEDLRREIEAVRASTEELNGRIGGLEEEARAMRASAAAAAREAEELSRRRMELEQRSAELRSAERDKTGEKEKIGHDLALMEERKANLQKEYDEIIAKLWEEYELTRREAEEEAGGRPEDPAAAQRRLAELKGSIKALGAVNVTAVEEYGEVRERYEFLTAQVADVEKSRDELGKLIGGLTDRMRELFSERFRQIDKNFLETFRDLFGGGTASISLSDPEDVLTSGIEISVQPPGKIVTHLEALSGGEKALVAIALYFAIMKVNPPPFCILDEIEAALDDVNVDRFAAYLRRMTPKTQFILITHRRGSMEEADVLYGVTMQDEGVSKLLEMPIAEMEVKMGIKSLSVK